MTRPHKDRERGLLSALRAVMSFDAEEYLRLYPDVAEAGGSPLLHYLRHGRKEGRIGGPADVAPMARFEGLDPARPVALVVGHEASRTGAPILTWNIVRELRESFQVVSTVLGPGDLEPQFEEDSDVFLGPIFARTRGPFVDKVVAAIAGAAPIRVAVINSIEALPVLPALLDAGVPTVLLIHEFATYTFPVSKFVDAFFYATRVVFSAEVVRDTALELLEDPGRPRAAVHPQGRCVLPARSEVGAEAAAWELDRVRIDRAAGPGPEQGGPVRILGAGWVQYRKGVDLFVAVAGELVRRLGPGACKFLWVGGNFDPSASVESRYLADQVRRSGLEGCFEFVPSVRDIDRVYDNAEIMLLPSRLDPLPNVAVDFLSRGKPVLCFEHATGVAEILARSEHGPGLVAPYMDLAGMADRLQALVEEPAHRAQVGEAMRVLAEDAFAMPRYLQALLEEAEAAVTEHEQEAADARALEDAGVLDPALVDLGLETTGSPARLFVRGWASGVRRRKPFAGFHPGVYRERALAGAREPDPTAHFLAAGRPAGPWCRPVIGPAAAPAEGPEAPVGLHLHVRDPGALPGVLERLGANRIRPELLVTLAPPLRADSVAASLARASRADAEVQEVPDHWLGLAALLTDSGREWTARFPVVGHLVLDGGDAGLPHILGGPGRPMADPLVAALLAEEGPALVFPESPVVHGPTDPCPVVAGWAARLGLDFSTDQSDDFPAHEGFWARREVLAALAGLELGPRDLPPRPLALDHSSRRHAVARFVVALAEQGRGGAALAWSGA